MRVSTAREDIVARACVVAAGAWARGLLTGAGIELPVIPTRETVTYFKLPGALDLPPVIDDAVPDPEEHGLRRPGLINYALGSARGSASRPGLHHAGPPTDPDEPGEVDPAVVRWVCDVGRAPLSRARPGADRLRDLHLHEHRRRVLRAGAARARRRRLGRAPGTASSSPRSSAARWQGSPATRPAESAY